MEGSTTFNGQPLSKALKRRVGFVMQASGMAWFQWLCVQGGDEAARQAAGGAVVPPSLEALKGPLRAPIMGMMPPLCRLQDDLLHEALTVQET